VGDIGAVEPLALLNERLRPDHFFGRAQSHRNVEDLVAGGMFEPLGVDAGEAVTGAVDHVDEILAAVCLAQPVREGHRGAIASFFQGTQRPFEVGRFDEHVKVLGVALDPRISGEGICSANQDVELGFRENGQRATVERLRLRLENLRQLLASGHAVCWHARN
jgi:hypothetical protein